MHPQLRVIPCKVTDGTYLAVLFTTDTVFTASPWPVFRPPAPEGRTRLCTPVRKLTRTSVALTSCRQQKECHSFQKGLLWLVDVKPHSPFASQLQTAIR